MYVYGSILHGTSSPILHHEKKSIAYGNFEICPDRVGYTRRKQTYVYATIALLILIRNK